MSWVGSVGVVLVGVLHCCIAAVGAGEPAYAAAAATGAQRAELRRQQSGSAPSGAIREARQSSTELGNVHWMSAVRKRVLRMHPNCSRLQCPIGATAAAAAAVRRWRWNSPTA